VAVYLLVLSFSVAILSVEGIDSRRFLDLIGAVVGFGVGYGCFAAAKGTGQLRQAFLFVGAAYALVCFIAVTNLYPPLFPVVNGVGLRDGEIFYRPEVTIDQNLQIFYLVPIALLMALENSTLRLIILLTIGAIDAFVLSEIQTRSGSLVFVATFVFAAIVGMRSRSKLDTRLIALASVGLLGGLLFINKIIHVFQNLIARFTVDDFDTLGDRTDAFLFTFKHLFDVEWWVPQGYRSYLHTTHAMSLPHSNITAIFVESGMLGLIGWILAVIVPLIVLGIRWLKKRTDPVADIALCGGASMLVTQLSLNISLVQFVWLWSGAVFAALMRREAAQATRPAAAEPGVSGEGTAIKPQRHRTAGCAPPATKPIATAAADPGPKGAHLRKIELTDRLERPASSLTKRPAPSLKRPLGAFKRLPP